VRSPSRLRAPFLAWLAAFPAFAATAQTPGATEPPVLRAPAPGGQSASALSEARLISAALESVHGLVAEFSQIVESAALPSAQVEKGTVYLQRPGQMRFEYAIPAGKLAIADGQRTWLYLPEDRQALVAPADGRAAESGVGILLQQDIDIARQFTAAWEEDPAGGERWLSLTPRVRRAEYERLLVRTTDDHLIRELAALDPLGGRVTYRFSRIRRAGRLDPDLFRFVAPRGVVVREAAP